MDPLRKIIMNRDHPDESNDITVEEGIDCRQADSRFFSLMNTKNHLNIIVSHCASLLSCKLDEHEIIVDPKYYNQSHETWAIGDRPFQKYSSQSWNCHVRGAELLLSTMNGSSSIMFELTPHNELNSIIKLKSIFLQNQVTYFNLNNAKERTAIDGHSLVVQCNGNLNRIQSQATKLLCRCNRRSPVLPKSFIGDIPFELVRHYPDPSAFIQPDELGTEDDFIVCDSIFYLEATSPLDFLKVQLQYRNRIMLFEVRMSPLPGGSASLQTLDQSAGVSSSTTAPVSNKLNTKAQFSDLRNNHSPADFIRPTSALNLDADDSRIDDDQHEASSAPNSSCLESPSTSSNELTNPRAPDTNNNNSSTPNPGNAQKPTVPSTILRARVRITNFGVCVMPLMMTNYSCTYRFSW